VALTAAAELLLLQFKEAFTEMDSNIEVKARNKQEALKRLTCGGVAAISGRQKAHNEQI